MPTPVKTLLLREIKTALLNVPNVGSVIRNPSKPPDRETATFPVIHVWDEDESVEERNRIARCTFPLQVDVWLLESEEAGSDLADVFQAEILKALLEDASIKQYALRIGPVIPGPQESSWSVKDAIDEHCYGLVLRFRVTYAHVWGDPYTLAKNP